MSSPARARRTAFVQPTDFDHASRLIGEALADARLAPEPVPSLRAA